MLIQKEIHMAMHSELLKEQLASTFDYSSEKLFREIDDCNL